MDVNPTFGRQELLETLSHSSNQHSSNKSQGSSSQGKSDVQRSDRSRNHNTHSSGGRQLSGSSLVNNSHFVDEAYRRVGQKLSLQAHGELPVSSASASRTASLTQSQASSFEPYPGTDQSTREMGRRPAGNNSSLDEQHERSDSSERRYRTPKVAKMRYSDHGEHHPRVQHPLNILRKLTFEGRDSYLKWAQDHRRRREAAISRRKDDEAGTSPQRHAFSRLALEGWAGSDGYRSHNAPPPPSLKHHSSAAMMGAGAAPTTKGLLSAVLEGHSDSATSASGPMTTDRSAYTSGSASLSISTKDSKTGSSSRGGKSGVSAPLQLGADA